MLGHTQPLLAEILRMTCMNAKSLQLCQTRCDPMDCSPPASPVHGILQARTLEWIAMPSSREMWPYFALKKNHEIMEPMY